MKPLVTDHADAAIRRHLLDGIRHNPRLTQRRAARDLGIALGIVNSQLKALVQEGLVRIKDNGGNRYTYHLTTSGEIERSRLTADALKRAFDPFRQARAECRDEFLRAAAKGWTRIALIGRGPLVEAAILSAAEAGVTLVGVIDDGTRDADAHGPAGFPASLLASPHGEDGIDLRTNTDDTEGGLPVRSDAKEFGAVHAFLITDTWEPDETFAAAARYVPAERILSPRMLGIRQPSGKPERGPGKKAKTAA